MGGIIFGKHKCSFLQNLRNKIGQYLFLIIQGLSPKALSSSEIHHRLHINWEKGQFLEAESLAFLLLESSYHPSLLYNIPLSYFFLWKTLLFRSIYHHLFRHILSLTSDSNSLLYPSDGNFRDTIIFLMVVIQ